MRGFGVEGGGEDVVGGSVVDECLRFLGGGEDGGGELGVYV